MTVDRPVIEVPTPVGGWADPWPNIAEIEAVLPHEYWTLVGGLMVQLHAFTHGIDAIRPTNDVDIVVHVETGRGRPRAVADALSDLGYEFQPSIDSWTRTAHRFRRDVNTIDLVTSQSTGGDVVDVVVADHVAPSVTEKLLGHDMVAIEGGTQALRRTVNATLNIDRDRASTVSVPDTFGALILKTAAHRADSRDPDRHLQDAAVLLACIEDPFAQLERESSGSDRRRLVYLREQLADARHPAWLPLTEEQRSDGLSALDVLAEGLPDE